MAIELLDIDDNALTCAGRPNALRQQHAKLCNKSRYDITWLYKLEMVRWSF